MTQRYLFIDRDGTLIEEPADEQVDSFSKLKFKKDVFKSLSFICKHLDFKLVMVTNQDGLGTASFPEETFWPVQNFVVDTLKGEGIEFHDILIDRHFPEDNSPYRKPGTEMLRGYIDDMDSMGRRVQKREDRRDANGDVLPFLQESKRRSPHEPEHKSGRHQRAP